MPPEQPDPAGQALPQLPQLLASVWGFVQAYEAPQSPPVQSLGVLPLVVQSRSPALVQAHASLEQAAPVSHESGVCAAQLPPAQA
jgi:hypothetical protein